MQKEDKRQTKVVAVADDCDETAAQKEPHKKVGRKGGRIDLNVLFVALLRSL